MQHRSIITVDGLAGSGKTSISRLLAEKLGFVHFNSGLLYRAVGWLSLSEGVDPDQEAPTAALLDTHKVELRLGAGKSTELWIDGRQRSTEVLDPQVSEATSKAAKHPRVRTQLLEAQRLAFPRESLVAEGRDMGTVIFPNASLKFYIAVTAEVKAERRLRQLVATGNYSEKDITELRAKLRIELAERDERDSKRETAPARAAADAVHIDNSAVTLTEVVETMYHLCLERLPPNS
jgi:cytidylate kinase